MYTYNVSIFNQWLKEEKEEEDENQKRDDCIRLRVI